MYKTELTKFKIANDGTVYNATVPISLFSILTEGGATNDLYYRGEAGERLGAMCCPCELSASFTLSSDAAGLKYAYLEIPDLDTAAEVIFNGGKGEFLVSGGREHRLDVSAATVAGENTVLIRISGSDTPRDITLFEGVRFIAFSRAHITDVSAKPVFIADSVSVDVSMEYVGDARDVKAVATLISPSGKLYYGGVNNGHALINVPDPLLWWPGRYGVQNLYKLSVNLYQDSEIADSREIHIGLRSVFKDDRENSAFTINGTPFFAMGVEYSMGGYAPVFTLNARSASLVQAAKDANANFIRFRGEGRYPCEVFLDCCDKKGIAIEFVLKSEKLERGEENAFRRELAYNLKRLSRHPSVISVAYEKSAHDERYETVISEVRSLALSSILIRGIEKQDTYRMPPSLPDAKTLGEVMLPEDMNLFSYVMEKHTESPEAAVDMLRLAAAEYKYAGTMDELVYVSGVLQARSAERVVRAARRRRGELGSVVLASLGDSEPSLSSALVDFSERPKTARYLATRFFGEIDVFANASDDGIVFTVSNESRVTFVGSLEFTVRDAANTPHYYKAVPFTSDRLSVCDVYTEDLSHVVNGHEREYYIDARIIGERGIVAQSVYLFVPPKHFRFEDPSVSVSVSGSGREYILTYSATAFAKDVVFSFGSHDVIFEDNCIDITSDAPSRIRFVTSADTTSEDLLADLSVKSMFDLGKTL